MLVDDDEPVLGLGDDVGRRHLAAGDPKRIAGHWLDRGLPSRAARLETTL